MKDTRTKLLKTSARIFARKGYSGTSVRDIVNVAHVNVSAIAYHFGGTPWNPPPLRRRRDSAPARRESSRRRNRS